MSEEWKDLKDALEKHRVIAVRYNQDRDYYFIIYLNDADKECEKIIEGEE